MNKQQLIEQIAAHLETTKSNAEKALDAVIQSVTDELKRGGEVTLTGFGSFKVSRREARLGRNPKTGESVDIVAANVPVFKAGKALKEAVNT